MATIAEALALAVKHHQAGNLGYAEEIYRRVLDADPGNTDARSNLEALRQRGQAGAAPAAPAQPERFAEALALNRQGIALANQGRHDEAAACFEQALRIEPNYPEAHGNLGNIFYLQGKHDRALASYHRGLQLKPTATLLSNMGIVLHHLRRYDESVEHYLRALQLTPDDAGIHVNLANALRGQGKLVEAAAHYRQALELKPDHADAANNLGLVLADQGKMDDAVACYERVLRVRPDHVEAHCNLGEAYRALRRYDDAIACYQRALRLKPDHAEAHNNLGNVLTDMGRLDDAIVSYRQALRLRPEFPEAHNNLGADLIQQGLLDEGLTAYRRALELRPDSPIFHSNLIYALHLHPGANAAALAAEHQRWQERHAAPLANQVRPHANDPDPDRRLRVGYVSLDFRRHPVGFFLLPLFEAHDRRQLEIVCYSSVTVPDDVTRRLAGHADRWREVAGLTDEGLAELVREDRIDILVDLSAHTLHNRLLAFARKPAPVQVTYLAYCSTTGLTAMDYRLTDPYLDPPPQPSPTRGEGETEAARLRACEKMGTGTGQSSRISRFRVGRPEPVPIFSHALTTHHPPLTTHHSPLTYTEQSVWLPETYWCYRPLIEVAPPGPLPARAAGHVTFGCLNNFCKVTAPTLAAWRNLLQAVPGSRLLLHAHSGPHRERVHRFFEEGAVDPGRIEFVGFTPLPDYFRLYDRIDIGLDPFPYAGGTTTCDALWMGVPVVSLAGETAVSRAGLSILSNVGLGELVAHTPQEYVNVAASLAGELAHVAELRSGLRERMQRSPLTDAPRFARNMEAAFRDMWRRWCATPHPTGAADAAQAEAHNNTGIALAQQERLDEAAARFRQAIRLKPDHAGAYNNLGIVLTRQGRFDEAVACYQDALKLNPEYADAHSGLGNALRDSGRWQEALACYDEALRLSPHYAEAYNNRGIAYARQGRLEEAVADFEQALRLKPDYPRAYSNLGIAREEQGKLDEALESYAQALRLWPEFTEARRNRSLVWLLQGNFKQGWPEYECRWQCPDHPRPALPQPLWDGSPLAGRTILLYAEQGLGDTLHFIRYVPTVKERGGRVIVACQETLHPLVASCPGIDQLLGQDAPLPAFDFHAPLLSLPGILGTDLSNVPADIPYLHADGGRVRNWRAELGAKSPSPPYSGERGWGEGDRNLAGAPPSPPAPLPRVRERGEISSPPTPLPRVRERGEISSPPTPLPRVPGRGEQLKIGIAWQGSPGYYRDQHRSIPLTCFAALGSLEGIQFFSLQKGPGTEQLAELDGSWPLVDLGSRFETFADTAAAIRGLDLVISADTAVAHCAGALGVPIWVAVPFAPDWRWLLHREDTAWYPNMRLFRQQSRGPWDDVFARIGQELRAATRSV